MKQHNIALYCPFNNEIVTPTGDFVPVPARLMRILHGQAELAKVRIIKRWAVASAVVNKECDIAVLS